VSLPTLAVSSISAGAAAIVVPLFWTQGTLLATAMTPVVVALVSEALRRPAERIGEVVPAVARGTATGAAMRRPARDRNRAQDTGRGRNWRKRALVTGLLAFLIAAAVLTASDLHQ
jgi:hypothetical protein